MKQISFGSVGRVYLFGGGRTLRYVGERLQERGFDVFVYSSSRLIDELVDGVSLGDYLFKKEIDFRLSDDVNKTINKPYKEDIGISFGSPWIFSKDFIKLFSGRLLNSHSRDLPRNRGAGGFSWVILNDDKRSASCLHLVNSGIDCGDIVKKTAFTFPDSCRIPIDYERYSFERDKLFFDEFIEELIREKTFTLFSQDDERSTYYPRLHSPTQGFIDWDWERLDIIRFINAFDSPYCGASTCLNGERVYLRGCIAADDKDVFHPFMSGIVYHMGVSHVFVAARGGGIVLSEVWDEENTPVIDEIRVGQRFNTCASDLEAARAAHPVYTSAGLKLSGGSD